MAKVNGTNCSPCGASILVTKLYPNKGRMFCASCYEWRFGTDPSKTDTRDEA